MMDTSAERTLSSDSTQRRHRSVAEKRRIVEETLAAGASVAREARAHGVNANQVFQWRRLYRAGRLDGTPGAVAKVISGVRRTFCRVGAGPSRLLISMEKASSL